MNRPLAFAPSTSESASPDSLDPLGRTVPEVFLQVLLDCAWDLFAVMDADGTVRYLSPSNYALLGHAPEDVVGTNGFELVHPDDRPQVYEGLAQLRNDPDTPLTLKHRFRAGDGAWRMLETTLQNKLDHPVIGGWVVHSRDVTDRDRLHAELERTQQHLRRLQIHPHFVLNVLNAIQGELHSDPAAAAETIAALGDLLRLSYAHVDTPMAPLAHEVDFVKRYVDLALHRFPESVTATFDVPDDLRSTLVPTLLLQPLVENALHHGLRPARGGRLSLQARRNGDTVCLTVFDSGRGPAAPSHDPDETGIGLSVTRERLQQIYGARATLRLNAAPEGGTVATIVLPASTASRNSEPSTDSSSGESGSRT